MSVPDGLARLAADPQLDAVWAAAHNKWCEMGGCAGAIPLDIDSADPVRRLLGRSNTQVSVRLHQLAVAVRGVKRLETILEVHSGELVDRRGARHAARDARRVARDANLVAWIAAMPPDRADQVRQLHLERRGGLPVLSGTLSAALRRAAGPVGPWSTFDDVGVGPRSAAWRVAAELLMVDRDALATKLRLCGHRAEARARALGLAPSVIAFAAEHGGRPPLTSVPHPQLDATLELCADLEIWVGEAAPPPQMLAVLAAERFDDPHALDRNEACGGVASRLLAARASLATSSAEGWARGWATAAVEVDRVSSRVLVAGLRPRDGEGGALADRLRAASNRGDEESLSVRQLSRDELPVVLARRVLVVENPPVFEVLMDDLEGDGRTAIVCSMGVPRVACTRLVRELVAQGVDVTASADFDAGGRTALAMLAAAGALPLTTVNDDRFEEQRLDELREWLRQEDSASQTDL